jgi:hypothetical protein
MNSHVSKGKSCDVAIDLLGNVITTEFAGATICRRCIFTRTAGSLVWICVFLLRILLSILKV